MSIRERISQENLLDDIFDAEFSSLFDTPEERAMREEKSLWENNTPPVSVEQFIEDSNYLGLSGRIYPAIMYGLQYLEHPDVREAIMMYGKGSGKSTTLQIFLSYSTYKVLCLKNPQEFYGLIPNTPITILLVSVSERQAKDVGFAGTSAMISRSPWFKGKFNPLSTEIRFEKHVNIYCGHSGATAFLGYNTICAAMDEVEYMTDNNNRSVSRELYRALKGSLTTRFPDKYKLLCVSSPKEEYSFLNTRFKAIKENGDRLELPEGIDVSRRDLNGNS